MKTLVHEEAYRGEKVIKKMTEQAFIVCGAGAIGSNLVDNMVRQGFAKITVIDFDRVNDHNRHTQIWTKRDLGQLKVTVLKNAMYNAREVQINALSVKLNESNISKLLVKGSVVIDGFDNVPSRELVTKHCTENKIDCLHIGLSQDFAEVVWNEIYKVPKENSGLDVCEYPMARNIVLMAITVASEVLVRFIVSGAKESYDITLKDLKIVPRAHSL